MKITIKNYREVFISSLRNSAAGIGGFAKFIHQGFPIRAGMLDLAFLMLLGLVIKLIQQ
jgi:hypothetical protein